MRLPITLKAVRALEGFQRGRANVKSIASWWVDLFGHREASQLRSNLQLSKGEGIMTEEGADPRSV